MTSPGLVLAAFASVPFLEGLAGQQIMVTDADTARVVEACFSARARRLLLHSTNLTPRFFDLSSREAGEVLQKLRNYRIRVAVLCARDVQASRRFAEFAAGENRGEDVRFFEETTREAAIQWLCNSV